MTRIPLFHELRSSCWILAATTLSVLGCSSYPAAIAPPDVEPAEVSEAVLADYDKDGDGELAATEIEAVPALHGRIEAFDQDGNDKISGDEFRAHLERIFDGKTGLMGADCRVTHNGRPLAGAIVYFVPPAFLEDALPVAGGVTASNGVAHMSIRPEDLPKNAPKVDGLVRPGIYSVEVTHPEIPIPENYNVKTTLGREISAAVTIAGPIDVPLKF